MIPFNKPFLSGNEYENIQKALSSGKLSGNGHFTDCCHKFFENRYHIKKCLLTTSCTDALEMSAILSQVQPGDEVIVPSYTFVSTANAFVLRGANIVFADSMAENPNIDPKSIETLITSKTKAIVVVHYAGVACDMDPILKIAHQHGLFVIEDAAQGIDSYYKGKPLGSIGNFATFSFHETKNIHCGEGGLLAINDDEYIRRAEVIWEKGTNRAAFYRGEVDKYNWVDIGSSFLLSELNASFLYAQFEQIQFIQSKRKGIWDAYYEGLNVLVNQGDINLVPLPEYATNNYHMFYILCNDLNDQKGLINYLKSKNIMAVFHYLPLHISPFYANEHTGGELKNSIYFSERIVRLPFFNDIDSGQIEYICDQIITYYSK